MNRLFIIIIIGAIAAVGGVAWALRHPAAPQQAAPVAGGEPREPRACCQKSPSRMSLLQGKAATTAKH